jgi:hypothetical protein
MEVTNAVLTLFCPVRAEQFASTASISAATQGDSSHIMIIHCTETNHSEKLKARPIEMLSLSTHLFAHWPIPWSRVSFSSFMGCRLYAILILVKYLLGNI